MTLNYFAFGSNLSSPRLLQRLPRATVHSVAILTQHRLCWRKNDQGQSGKCDIAFTDDDQDIVYGVVYRMTIREQLELDGYESAGFGYQRKRIKVHSLSAGSIDAFTYYALDINDLQRPFHWYKEHVLRGAVEHRFPQYYVEDIRSAASIDDPDRERHQRELAIYSEL